MCASVSLCENDLHLVYFSAVKPDLCLKQTREKIRQKQNNAACSQHSCSCFLNICVIFRQDKIRQIAALV